MISSFQSDLHRCPHLPWLGEPRPVGNNVPSALLPRPSILYRIQCYSFALISILQWLTSWEIPVSYSGSSPEKQEENQSDHVMCMCTHIAVHTQHCKCYTTIVGVLTVTRTGAEETEVRPARLDRRCSLVSRPCVFIACSTKFAIRADRGKAG